MAIVQDPGTAAMRRLPEAALAATAADAVLPLSEMGKFLYGLCCPSSHSEEGLERLEVQS